MILSAGIIKSAMIKRGFKHRRTEDQFAIRGEYARNLQYVYSKEYKVKGGVVIDLVYFAADMVSEELVVGLYRENTQIENGVYINNSLTIKLTDFNETSVNQVLDKLIPFKSDRFE